jgi:uncharacterized protein
MSAKRFTAVKTILDANILVSSVFGGVPAKAVERALLDEVWISPTIQKELYSLARPLSKRLSPEKFKKWNEVYLPLIAIMRLAVVRHQVHLSRDLKDDIYLSLALAVSADYLVTGDKDLLTLKKGQLDQVGLKNLSIITPRIYLDRTGN